MTALDEGGRAGPENSRAPGCDTGGGDPAITTPARHEIDPILPDAATVTRRFLDELGYQLYDRISVCWSQPAFSFVVVTVAEAPAVVAAHAECDVWISTCTLRDGELSARGSVDDVVAVRSLWADLDVKRDGLQSVRAARLVIDDLSKMLGARPVAVVLSGHGLQPRWAIEDGDLVDDTAREDAAALLRRWHRLVAAVAERRGGLVDNVYDLARIMRAPVGMNTKGCGA